MCVQAAIAVLKNKSAGETLLITEAHTGKLGTLKADSSTFSAPSIRVRVDEHEALTVGAIESMFSEEGGEEDVTPTH